MPKYYDPIAYAYSGQDGGASLPYFLVGSMVMVGYEHWLDLLFLFLRKPLDLLVMLLQTLVKICLKIENHLKNHLKTMLSMRHNVSLQGKVNDHPRL